MKRRDRRAVVMPWAALTVALMSLVNLVYRWQSGIEASAWLRQWGLVPARFWQDDPLSLETGSRLFSAIFVHVDVGHLLGNIVFLALFAPRVEARLGPARALGLYLFCGALANGLAAWQAPDSRAAIVGASGVVSALLGAFMVLFPHARIGVILPLGLYFQIIRVPSLILISSWFGLQLMYTLWLPGVGAVAWWTHIVGFVSGVILAAPARWYRGPGGNR